LFEIRPEGGKYSSSSDSELSSSSEINMGTRTNDEGGLSVLTKIPPIVDFSHTRAGITGRIILSYYYEVSSTMELIFVEETDSPFYFISEEIVINLFQFCSSHSKYTLTMVCKYFRRLVCDKTLKLVCSSIM
jgi:hypothetical protein